MLNSTLLRPLLIAFALLLGLASCADRPPVASVDNVWVRMPAAPGTPAGGYFTASLSRRDDAITGISSPSADRIEMHDVREENGVTRMVQLDRADQDGLQPIHFEPGGKHLMIFGLDSSAPPGSTIEMTFTFAEAPPVTVRAQLVPPAAGAPEHMQH